MMLEEFENIQDLENVGNCIISRSEKVLMTRMPIEKAFMFFDITSTKYTYFEVNNEDDEEDNTKVFIIAKYKKDVDFKKDIETVCGEQRNVVP